MQISSLFLFACCILCLVLPVPAAPWIAQPYSAPRTIAIRVPAPRPRVTVHAVRSVAPSFGPVFHGGFGPSSFERTSAENFFW